MPWSALTRHPRRVELLVVAVALVVRVLALLDGRDDPTFAWPVVDAATYDQAARAFASGAGLDYHFFWQPFLYPVYLGLTYLISGGSILFAKSVQLLLGVLTCVLTARCGRRLLGPSAGLLAGLICALHGPSIFFETQLVATGWASFWVVVLLDRISRPAADFAQESWSVTGMTGLLGALAVLTRPTFLPALLLAGAWQILRGPAERRVRRVAFATTGFALAVVPVMLIGQSVADYPGFLPASGAMNLYLGNHPEPCAVLTIRPGEAWQELGREARPTTAGDLNANRTYFRDQLVANITAAPASIAAGLLRKGTQVLSSRELPRNVDPYVQREWSSVLSVLMFRVGKAGFPGVLLIPFALLGTWTMRRKVGAPFLIFTGAYLLGIVAVFVSARYRVPVTPALAILAAAGGLSLAAAIRAGARQRVVVMVVALVLLAAGTSVPGPWCEELVDYRGETLYAVGYAQHQAGQDQKAAKTYQLALAQTPDNTELLNQFALLRSQQGRDDEAIGLWLRATRVDPSSLTVRLNLGRAYTVREAHTAALEQYDAALAIEPTNANALLGSGFALLGVARFDEGVQRLEQAVQREQDFAARLVPVPAGLRSIGREDLALRIEAAIRHAGG